MTTTAESQKTTGRRTKAIREKRRVAVANAGVSTVSERIQEILIDEEPSRVVMIERVRRGLPITSVERVRSRLQIRDAERVLRLLGMSPRTYLRYKKEQRPLDAVQSDRLYRLARIEARAVEVFSDEGTANDWLKSENRALDAVPLDLLDTEAGTEQVEHVLTRIEHGVYS